MTQDRLRVGVIGAGLQGRNHLACYAALPQAEITAVADIDAERAREASGDDGLAVLRVTAAIVESARQRRIIELA